MFFSESLRSLRRIVGFLFGIVVFGRRLACVCRRGSGCVRLFGFFCGFGFVAGAFFAFVVGCLAGRVLDLGVFCFGAIVLCRFTLGELFFLGRGGRRSVVLLAQKNQQNEVLLKQAIELTEYDITLFKSLRQAPETANYNNRAYNTGVLLGGSGFDAKQ